MALNVNNITSETLYSGGYYDWGEYYYWQSEALINARLSITYKF